MATKSLRESRTYGQAILDRLAKQTLPAALKPHAATFKKTHTAYEAACGRVDDARAVRDAALEFVGDKDDDFDDVASDLANEIVGARLGKRQNPFAGFSKYSPSQLATLPYAMEPAAAKELVDSLKKASAPANVTKAAKKLLNAAKALDTALNELTAPQAAFTKAILEREEQEQTWSKAMRKLKKHATALWDDSPATYKAVFSSVESVQAPKKKRARAKTAAAKKTGKGSKSGGAGSSATPS